MKYVKCINPLGVNLTHQKIYEVKRSWISDWSNLTYHVIVNDLGDEVTFDMVWFEDADAEIRQNKLEELGI